MNCLESAPSWKGMTPGMLWLPPGLIHTSFVSELDGSSRRLVIPTSHPVQESLGQITSRWWLGLCGAPLATAAEPACQSAAAFAFVLGESVRKEGFDLEPSYVSWALHPRVLVLHRDAASEWAAGLVEMISLFLGAADAQSLKLLGLAPLQGQGPSHPTFSIHS